MAARMNVCYVLRSPHLYNRLLSEKVVNVQNIRIQKCRYSQVSRRFLKSGRIPQRLSSKPLHLEYVVPLSSIFSRNNSSSLSGNASDASSFIPPPDYIPPAPPIPEPASAVGDLAQSLNALGEPTLQSLGLGSFWPPGLIQQGLEALHATVGLPWWGSIIAGTLVLRVCMFPIVIKARRMTINLMNHMPTVQKLQEKFTDARQRGNMMEAMQIGGELGDYMKRNNVKPFGQLMMPLIQAPIFMSVFVGLRGMANLPVESLKTGGCLWFTDLTVAQPFYTLPLLTSFTFLLTIEAGTDGMSSQSQTHVMKWMLRAMPVIMLPIITNFPTAMLVYWLTSNVFSLAQVLFLKIPQVETYFKIPKRVEHPPLLLKKKGFLDGFQESWGNMKASQKVMERQKLDERMLRKAAQGPIIKTYSYNPKDIKTIKPKSVSPANKTKP